MTSGYARTSFFDASALIKVYTDEPGSVVVQKYFQAEATKYTSTFCFYETLNVLKSKWKYQEKLTKEEYLKACFALAAWHSFNERYISNPELTQLAVLTKACELVQTTDLDMSDAMQIISVQTGYCSSFVEGSKTVFVTADRRLAVHASAQGLRVWNVLDEDPPQ